MVTSFRPSSVMMICTRPPTLGHRSKEMRPVILHAALNLNEVARYLKALGRSEALDRFLLGPER
jgi:hypothetical protein